MQVYVVDRSVPGSGIVGRMEAQVGMTTILGNRITKINGDSCLIESRSDGSLSRKTGVSILLDVAIEFGYQNGHRPAAPPPPEKKGSKRGGRERQGKEVENRSDAHPAATSASSKKSETKTPSTSVRSYFRVNDPKQKRHGQVGIRNYTAPNGINLKFPDDWVQTLPASSLTPATEADFSSGQVEREQQGLFTKLLRLLPYITHMGQLDEMVEKYELQDVIDGAADKRFGELGRSKLRQALVEKIARLEKYIADEKQRVLCAIAALETAESLAAYELAQGLDSMAGDERYQHWSSKDRLEVEKAATARRKQLKVSARPAPRKSAQKKKAKKGGRP